MAVRFLLRLWQSNLPDYHRHFADIIVKTCAGAWLTWGHQSANLVREPVAAQSVEDSGRSGCL